MSCFIYVFRRDTLCGVCRGYLLFLYQPFLCRGTTFLLIRQRFRVNFTVSDTQLCAIWFLEHRSRPQAGNGGAKRNKATINNKQQRESNFKGGECHIFRMHS